MNNRNFSLASVAALVALVLATVIAPGHAYPGSSGVIRIRGGRSGKFGHMNGDEFGKQSELSGPSFVDAESKIIRRLSEDSIGNDMSLSMDMSMSMSMSMSMILRFPVSATNSNDGFYRPYISDASPSCDDANDVNGADATHLEVTVAVDLAQGIDSVPVGASIASLAEALGRTFQLCNDGRSAAGQIALADDGHRSLQSGVVVDGDNIQVVAGPDGQICTPQSAGAASCQVATMQVPVYGDEEAVMSVYQAIEDIVVNDEEFAAQNLAAGIIDMRTVVDMTTYYGNDEDESEAVPGPADDKEENEEEKESKEKKDNTDAESDGKDGDEEGAGDGGSGKTDPDEVDEGDDEMSEQSDQSGSSGIDVGIIFIVVGIILFIVGVIALIFGLWVAKLCCFGGKNVAEKDDRTEDENSDDDKANKEHAEKEEFGNDPQMV